MDRIKKLLTFFLILQSFPNPLHAGIFDMPVGGRPGALGYTSICQIDFWSAINNQAGLASINKISAGISVENKFLIESLNTKSLAVAIPFANGTIGVSLNRFGETNYNETSVGLSFGMKLSNNFSVGIQLFNYTIHQSNELGNAGLFSFQGGFIFEKNQNFRLAFHFFNPQFITHGTQKPELPGIIKLGFALRLTETLHAFFEVQNHSISGNGINSGIEYKSSDHIAFRIGYASLNEKLTFGIGLKLKKLHIDLSSSMQNMLGYSPQVSMTYEF